MKTLDNRNRVYFGLGTVGRDMFYAFEANTLLFFLSDVLSLPVWVFAAASLILSVLRIFDAFNDPITGLVVDNIRSPWGKFKPAILVGGILSAVFSLVLFGGIGEGWTFVIIFGIAYFLWDVTYGINDIGYWTLLPVLSSDQKQREKTGAFARICANVGMYIVMVAWQPVTNALGNTPKVWFWCAVVIAAVYLLGLLFPLLGIREKRDALRQQESTTVRQMVRALVGNDQLMWTTLAMGLFMVGYCTTVNFAIYYMKYIFGNEGMYVVLVAVVGVSQLATLAVYPKVARKLNRRQLYTLGTALVVLGYLIFFFAEVSLVLIALAAVLVFVGQAFIQTLMLMFLADTVEYGYWKLGKKNEAITFSIQPFINKIGGALATGIVSLTLILSGIKIDGGTADVIDAGGKMMVKGSMFFIPLLMIVVGYLVYLKKYKIDEARYAQILKDLEARENAQDSAERGTPMEHIANIRPFGTTAKGETVHAVTLQSEGLTCEILTFGATIRTLWTADRHGHATDVVLGYDTLAEYEAHDGYLGAVPGRYANRIARCHIAINGQDYTLTCNDGENHLHGGTEGFSHRVWAITACSGDCVTLSLTSPDGDQGYPAALTASVTYTLQGSTLTIDYRAETEGDTYCNLTNHSYFNLAGHNGGSVLQQELTLCADRFTPTDASSIPTGELAAVADTPMDFTRAVAIGARIDEDYVQLQQAKGYDHNFVLRRCDGTLQHAATVFCAETGITMEVATTQPGVQVYTANYLTPRKGKGGCTYSYRHGLCLETQHFPDSPHHPHFPSTLLRKGERYHEITAFAFSHE